MTDYEGLEEEYYQVLQSLQNDLYKTKTNKPSVEVLLQLNHVVAKIQEKRKLEKENKKRTQEKLVAAYPAGGPQRLRELDVRAEPPSSPKPKRIRPYYLKVLGEVFSPDCLNEVNWWYSVM